MAFVLADRVRETSTTTGTGTFTLAGAAAGFRTFASGIGAHSTTYVATMATQWEVGIGTVSGASLSRDTVLASTNAGARVSWAAGTKDIRCDATATHLSQMLLGSVRWGGTSTGTNTIVVAPSPALLSYTAGLTVGFIAGDSNTGASTINCGAGAVTLLRSSGAALQSGDVVDGNLYFIVFASSSAARILNPQVVAPPGGGGDPGVTSFNGRTGAVVPGGTDYTAGMIAESTTRLWFTSTERNKLATGVVTSFKGTGSSARTGAVVAQAGDYNAQQVSETSSHKIMTADERSKLAGLPQTVPTTTLRGPFTLGGSVLSITSIPANAKSLTLMINQASTTAVSDMQVRLGDSGGIEASGYAGLCTQLRETEGVDHTSDTSGWVVAASQAAGVQMQGQCILSLQSGGNRWIGSSTISSGGSKMCISTTIKDLSATLTQIELRVFGASFDAGDASLLIGT